jgi:hypothetical protein
LLEHVNHILMNQFRQELGLGNPWDQPLSDSTGLTTNDQATVLVDGLEVPAVEVGTSPFVYGIGAGLPDGGTVTAVLPRAELSFIQIQFMTRR